MRKLFTLFTLCISILLTGCTVTSDRIYTVCKYDTTTTYCYNASNEFFIVTDKGFVPHSGVTLQNKPALCVIPEEYDFSFVYVMPGLYEGTLQEVNGYIHLLQNDGYSYDVMSADWNNLDIILTNGTKAIRLLYNIQGEVRIYLNDGFHNSITPPYISES